MQLRKKKRRILVADDDGDFRRVIRAILEHAGFSVDTAEDGEKALKAIKKRKYDLLILDLFMPRIDGFKFFSIVKKSKKYSRVPVIFISGQVSRQELAEQQRETVDKSDEYLEKPIKTRELIEKVKAIIEK